MKSTLSSMLVYNGIIQFSLLFIFNMLTMIFDVLSITLAVANQSNIIIMTEMLSAIVICRFMLNLRDITFAANPSEFSHSGIQFANSVIGNIGAPLKEDSLFFSSSDDSTQEEEETSYNGNPLDQSREVQLQELPERQSLEEAGPSRDCGHISQA
ncbi:hypothetical protein K474DRAFT_1164029 [Panus rudis PR-1116 ss-1]|nr:hypothetical protein K474DRAFT_1164029 [Panus rudis PR-1116 ss-1]